MAYMQKFRPGKGKGDENSETKKHENSEKKKPNKKLLDDLVKQGTLVKKVAVNDNRRDIFEKAKTMPKKEIANLPNEFPKGSVAHRRMKALKKKNQPY